MHVARVSVLRFVWAACVQVSTKLYEGMRAKTGMGAAIMVDVDRLLARGQLDAQAADEFNDALAGCVVEGMPCLRDGRLKLHKDFCVVQGDSCLMFDLLAESAHAMLASASSWSAAGVAAELATGSFAAFLDHIMNSVHCFETAHVVAWEKDLRHAWQDWDARLAATQALREEWVNLSKGCYKPAMSVQLDSDTVLARFADSMTAGFVRKAHVLTRQAPEHVHTKMQVLQECLQDCQTRSLLRREVATELSLVNKVFGCELMSDEDMLGSLSRGADGILTHLVQAAEGRQRAQPLWAKWRQPDFQYEIDIDSDADLDSAREEEDGCEQAQGKPRGEEAGQVEALAATQGDGAATLPFLKMVQEGTVTNILFAHFLAPTVKVAAQTFFDHVALSMAAKDVDVAAMSKSPKFDFPAIVEATFCSPEARGAMAASVGDVVAHSSSTLHDALQELYPLKVAAACQRLVKLQPSATVEVAMRNPEPTSMRFGPDLFDSVVLAFGDFVMLAHGLVWVADKLRRNAVVISEKDGPCVLDPTVVSSVKSFSCLAKRWLAVSSSVAAACGGEDGLVLKSNLCTMDRCAQAISDELLAKLKASLMDAFSDVLGSRSAEVVAKTPRYGHIVSEKKYNSALAKRQLLDDEELRTQLPRAATHLAQLLTSISTCVEEWGLGDPKDRYDVQSAQGAIDAAKESLVVVAAVNCVELGKTAKGRAMAEKILQTKPVLPAALKQKLMDVAGWGF